VQLGAFGFTVRADQALVKPQVVADSDPYLDGNPDVNDAIVGT